MTHQEPINLVKSNDKNNNKELVEIFIKQVDHEEVIADEGVELVKSFERLMKLFPTEHPSGIHGILVICNNNIEKALDMLLYVSQCRKLDADKTCLNCTATESETEILEDSLKKIDEKTDDYDGEEEEDEEYTPTKRKTHQQKQEENKLKKTPKMVIKLRAFDAPKKKKEPRYTVPTKASLKAVYTDYKSQFVKIGDSD